MANPTGTVKIELSRGLTEVPAFRIGKFWATNKSDESSPYFNVTHRMTGKKLIGYIGFRRAQRLVGVLDVLMPTELSRELEHRWQTFPEIVRQSLLEQ
jgi:hypothetical protein